MKFVLFHIFLLFKGGDEPLYLPDKPVGELLHKSIDLVPVSKHAARSAEKDKSNSPKHEITDITHQATLKTTQSINQLHQT